MQNSNFSITFSEIWYVDASQQKKILQKLFIDYIIFWPFLIKKQPKLTKNEENFKNLNWLITFTKIWYLDVSPEKKMIQKNCSLISALFGLFCSKKQSKLTNNEKKWAKSKPFNKVFWNLVCRCFPTKKMLQKTFLDFGLFLAVF